MNTDLNLNRFRCPLLLLCIIPLLACAEKQKQPNIVFIFADDWGWGDLGVHGSDQYSTPNIDKLASQGTDFYHFTVSSPVCSPSRVAVVTGQFPERHNIDRHFSTIENHIKSGMPDWLDPTAPMLPRVLGDAGYATGHFGKWHLTNIWVTDAPLPDQYGFDEFGAFNLPGENMPSTDTADRAVDFIRRHKDEPFFVNLWMHETHTPHYPEQDLIRQFEHLGEAEQVYAAVLKAGDRDVGKILDVLDELALSRNTIVIFSSDNGPESSTPTRKMEDLATGPGLGRFYSVGTTAGMRGQKRSLYSGGVRVPLIVRWPGVVAGGVKDKETISNAVDLFPTLTDIAGVELPTGYRSDGESIRAALIGESFERQKPVYWVWPAEADMDDPTSPNWPNLAYQRGNWKLLTNSQLGKTELYRVREDWYESNDVASSHPEIVKSLLVEMNELRATFPGGPAADAFSKLRKLVQADAN